MVNRSQVELLRGENDAGCGLSRLWDADGTDTISVSNFTLACTIDLTPGAYSSLKYPVPNDTGGYTPTYDGTDNLRSNYTGVVE